MNSKIFVGEVVHARSEKVKHAFRYPAYFFAFDLDEWQSISKESFLFGHNRFRVFSIFDRDYLTEGPGPILEKLKACLIRAGCGEPLRRVILVTSPRFFGHVFNPVSFYYCYAESGALRYVVAEVNNTFHERHLYVLDRPRSPKPGFAAHFVAAKEFHVSPFFDGGGDYDFYFSEFGEHMNIRISLARGGRQAIFAKLEGDALPFESKNLRRVLFRFPLTAFLTLPRILWQAAQLHYLKKLPAYDKPIAVSPMTIRRARPTWFQAMSARMAFRFFSLVRQDCIRMVLPDRSVRFFGDETSSLCAEIKIHDWKFFSRILKAGDIGFGESYMAGEWDSGDLTALLEVFVRNMEAFDRTLIRAAWWGAFINGIRHWLRKNTSRMSRKNIAEHYDLSNEFYEIFLDPTMTYSCAFFRKPEDSLEEAQLHKLHLMIDKARIKPADHVLEIGSGWGSLAMESARRTGCRVTGITLSEKQLEFSRARVREAGLSGKINFELRDYRSVEGKFDKILSVEMLEAVGHDYFGRFFRRCDELLKPGGLCVLQVITIPDQRYDAYRVKSDWIQKHIFPGGLLPSLSALSWAMKRHSRFVVEDLEDIGIHYARTLREWRENFSANEAQAEKLGFDGQFRRKWRYYFSYCEAGFETKTLQVLQMVLRRPGE